MLGARQFPFSTLKYVFFRTPNYALFSGCECYLSAIEFLIQALYLCQGEANLRFQKNENNLRYLSFD